MDKIKQAKLYLNSLYGSSVTNSKFVYVDTDSIKLMYDDRVKDLCTAVVVQACKDYKKAVEAHRKDECKQILKWFEGGNLFTDIAMPEFDADLFTARLKTYGKKSGKTKRAKA